MRFASIVVAAAIWAIPCTAAIRVEPVRSQTTATAPDGRRGLGSETKLSDVLSLIRSSKDSDRSFLAELEGLATEVAVVAATTLDRYKTRGYYDLLERNVEPTLAALHARFAELELEPFEVLSAGGPKGRALARLLVDTRFRARAHVLASYELEVREVRNGMAVLRGACDGFVSLTQSEASSIAARIDLSAATMRAMRSDLLVLRQARDDAEVDQHAEELHTIATASEGEGVRRAGVERECERWSKLESDMVRALFTSRLRDELRPLLDWRARVFEESEPLRESAWQYLPDSEAGRSAPDEIRRLQKHERMRGAGFRASKALEIDPLDAEAAWIAAHASDFLYGLTQSRPWYDRFLALHGIRAHDHRTYAERELDAREREALDAVQRAVLQGSGSSRGQ